MRRQVAVTVYLYPDEVAAAEKLMEPRHVNVGHYLDDVVRDHLIRETAERKAAAAEAVGSEDAE